MRRREFIAAIGGVAGGGAGAAGRADAAIIKSPPIGRASNDFRSGASGWNEFCAAEWWGMNSDASLPVPICAGPISWSSAKPSWFTSGALYRPVYLRSPHKRDDQCDALGLAGQLPDKHVNAHKPLPDPDDYQPKVSDLLGNSFMTM